MPALRFRLRPIPPLDQLDPLLVAQLGMLLEMAKSDGPDGHELIQVFDVLDEHGEHLYDLPLFCADDGGVYERGTMKSVASFSQGGATGSDDEAFLAALNHAYFVWYEPERQARAAARAAAASKGPAKKR